MSLLIAIFGFTLLAIVTILDKFIVSSDRIRPIVVAFYSTAPLVFIFFLVPFQVAWLKNYFDWFLAVVSGVAFLGALLAMYAAFEKSEVSHTGPLVGAAIPLFIVILSGFFLAETITLRQYSGIGLLIIGSLLTSFQKTRSAHGFTPGMWLAIISAALFAVSHVAAKYLYDRYGFYSGFVWTRGFMGAAGLLLAFFPSVYTTFRHRRPRFQWFKKRTSAAKATVVLIDKVLGVIGVVLLQYATAIGSVSLVNALAGVQYALLIVGVAVLSKFFPRLFREEYGQGEMFGEIVAIILIMAGLYFVVV